jgi:hypothetical protein
MNTFCHTAPLFYFYFFKKKMEKGGIEPPIVAAFPKKQT